MIISIVCLLIAAIMPYIFVGYAKFAQKGYDNHAPREYLAKQEGAIKRAYHAHLNAFEAFPAFAVAVIIGYLAGISEVALSSFSVIFIISRTFYGYFYITDQPTLRSTVWIIGFLSVLALYILAIFAL